MFGQASKKELCYENLKITKNAWDSNIIHSNGKYLLVSWDSSGGGAFAIIPVEEVGKAPDTVPLFRGHKGPVLDTAFNPFNPRQVASCSDDGNILIWDIPEEFSFHNYRDEADEVKDVVTPLKVLSGHTRKVGHIEYHPCAENVLASSSMDYSVKIWNVDSATPEISLQHKDLVTSFAFNYNGSLLATIARDKVLRIWDLRSGKVISEGPGHSGAKASRVIWLGNTDRVCTTGFSRLSDRQVGIWDVNDISKGPIGGFMFIDSSSGVLIPIYDDATCTLYLAGKGDGNIRYYEYENDVLHELSQYASTDAQRGFAAAPKTSVNIKENEILKCYKTVNDSSIEPVSFIVPRKSEVFQEDIYPDAPSDKPALTALEWFGGKDVNGPLLVKMEAIYEGKPLEVKESSPAVKVSEKKSQDAKEKPRAKESSDASPQVQSTPSLNASPAPSASVDEALKSSSTVGSLINKVVDQSDDEDSRRIAENPDDDWEEIKPVRSEGTLPVKEDLPRRDPKPAQEKSDSKDHVQSGEVKGSKSEVKEPKSEVKEPKSEVEPKPEVKEQQSEAKGPKKDEEPKTHTLRSTVEKLAGIVDSLESQVTKLAQANAEKNTRLEALEKKIDQLLAQ